LRRARGRSGNERKSFATADEWLLCFGLLLAWRNILLGGIPGMGMLDQRSGVLLFLLSYAFVYLPDGRNHWKILMCTLALLSLLIRPCSSANLRFCSAISFFASRPLRIFGKWTEEILRTIIGRYTYQAFATNCNTANEKETLILNSSLALSLTSESSMQEDGRIKEESNGVPGSQLEE
jgi:hypothetical protein